MAGCCVPSDPYCRAIESRARSRRVLNHHWHCVASGGARSISSLCNFQLPGAFRSDLCRNGINSFVPEFRELRNLEWDSVDTFQLVSACASSHFGSFVGLHLAREHRSVRECCALETVRPLAIFQAQTTPCGLWVVKISVDSDLSGVSVKLKHVQHAIGAPRVDNDPAPSIVPRQPVSELVFPQR